MFIEVNPDSSVVEANTGFKTLDACYAVETFTHSRFCECALGYGIAYVEKMSFVFGAFCRSSVVFEHFEE